MAILLDQTQQQFEDSASFAANSEIRSVRLVNANLASKPAGQFLDVDQELATMISFGPGTINRGSNWVHIEIKFSFRVVKKSTQEGEPVNDEAAHINCSLLVGYEFHEGFQPTEDQILAFQHSNAVFNCWPFFREFVQNSIVRMEYPAPPIPFLMFRKASEKQTPNE